MKSRFAIACLLSLPALLLTNPASGRGDPPAQDGKAASADRSATEERARMIVAAREIMGAQTYCALITIDEAGRPQVRTMNPFPPEGDMAVWFATNPRSRKAREIRRDPRVSLYYADHAKATGYVSIAGRAVLVDDMKEILKRKRAYWDQAFPGLKNLVLVKVVPERLEVINYKAGLQADPETWKVPSLDLGSVEEAAPRP